MVKSEIISMLSDKIRRKIKKSELEKIFNLILKTIIEEIKYQKATEIRRFGRFYPKKIKERINARNPRTGKTVHSKEKLSIAFKMSKELKYTINKNEGNLN